MNNQTKQKKKKCKCNNNRENVMYYVYAGVNTMHIAYLVEKIN